MMHKYVFVFLLLLFAGNIFSQQTLIPLYDTPAPGSEQWNWKESETEKTPIGKRILYNVTSPALMVFTPAEGKANGAAVILAPGGGLRVLNVEHEGTAVANELVKKGITVFVLKYRVIRSISDDPWKEMMDKMKDSAAFQAENAAFRPMAYADLKTAIMRVRQMAAAWKLDTKRIGVIGFSAGAIMTVQLAMEQDATLRPDFCGILYGNYKQKNGEAMPATVPPAFIACAADDKLAPPVYSLQLCQAWLSAGSVAELHIYASGGHGLRMGIAPTWIQRMADWMQERKIIPQVQ